MGKSLEKREAREREKEQKNKNFYEKESYKWVEAIKNIPEFLQERKVN
ncbi:hypothetical protein CWATWH0402_836 [Crocosphaera watsonii WH 0402]|uniref:Uncharacterized protein n=1 Tax=Crocosphaera watsonii WH 0402 TaxID=1284629 RepID=T2JSJ9_CROWT|nr:hypothetical protein [Crocosphaera watsonii]CCQ68024.1 hypothetical protein CWATWH0402_836 [Crocosphaera watsonii WH 0402]